MYHGFQQVKIISQPCVVCKPIFVFSLTQAEQYTMWETNLIFPKKNFLKNFCLNPLLGYTTLGASSIMGVITAIFATDNNKKEVNTQTLHPIE